uniref:Metallophosphoesterase n=1 Tax=Prevotella sp. GTC17259 TaxID=3236795 RepID=A0AB33J2G3_9BACT
MNTMWAIIFFLLPIIGCSYVGWHVWMMLPFSNLLKAVIIAGMVLCFSMLILNFLVGPDNLPPTIARIVYETGTSSLFVLLYLVMLFLLLDLGRAVHIVPASFLHSSIRGTLSVLVIISALFIYGNLHYYDKVRVPLNFTTEKPLHKPLKIVLMSDLHLGYHNTRADLAQWVNKVNSEHADLVLIAGDIVDISVEPLLRADMAEEFRRLQAPVYAALGNHDYYAGEPKSERFYRAANIHLLRDSSIVFNSELTIIGRDDRTNKHRKSLKELVAAVDQSTYTILLDHQPYHLEEAERAGIDFQFSGHTHYGQVWPISWIEDAIYEDAFGPLTKGKTEYYVSSGIGIWGGKFRIGTRSEYVVLTLTSVK